MRTTLIVLTLIALPTLVYADNFERLAATEPAFDEPLDDQEQAALPTVTERSIFAGFNLSRGNSDTSLFYLRGLYSRDRQRDVLRIEAETQHGDESGETSEDASRALIDYKHLFSRYAFLGVGSNFERDDPAGLRYRVTVYPSIGRFLTRTETLRWLVEAGPSYVFEETRDRSDNYLALRVGQRLEARVTESTKMFQEVYTTWKAADDFLLTAGAGLDVAINSTFGVVLTARNDYDATPADGKKKNDLSLISSLRASF